MSYYYDSPEYYDGEDYAYATNPIPLGCLLNPNSGDCRQYNADALKDTTPGITGGWDALRNQVLGEQHTPASVGTPPANFGTQPITDAVGGELNAIQQGWGSLGKTVTDSVGGELNAIQQPFKDAAKNAHQWKLDTQKGVCAGTSDDPGTQIQKFIVGCEGSSPGLGSWGCLPGVPSMPPLGCLTIPVAVAGGLVLLLLLKSR